MYDYSVLLEDLMVWYKEKKRSLPWRSNPKPYYVWVSEIMLQQTRVEAVKEYFNRFILELPQIEDLALADEEKLLKLWEGLGYYSRVRNLKKAAKILMEEYNGVLPADYQTLLKLPGIGSYTAGAIASIAYDICVPAVDGNVLRVTKRLSGSFDDIKSTKVKSNLEAELTKLMQDAFGNESKQAGILNQAWMELGAVVCIPNGAPLCQNCPVCNYCVAKRENLTSKIPVKAPKKERRLEDKTILVLEYQGKYAIRKRDSKGLLATLWELPNTEEKLNTNAIDSLLTANGILDYKMELLGEAKHIFSHVEWHMIGYKIAIQKILESDSLIQDFVWVEKNQLINEYALPTAFKAYRP